jgi:hypothetical protein
MSSSVKKKYCRYRVVGRHYLTIVCKKKTLTAFYSNGKFNYTSRRHIVDCHFSVNRRKKSEKRIVTLKWIDIVQFIVIQATGGRIKNEWKMCFCK